MMQRRSIVATLIFLLGGLPVFAVAQEGGHFLDDPAAKKYALILVGASADEEHARKFAGWAGALKDILAGRDYRYEDNNVTLLLGDGSRVEGVADDGPCRLENIRKVMADLAGKIKAADQLSIFMIGHGSGSGENAKFNIAGPDITGPQFAEMLAKVKTQDVIVVNATSASHDFSEALSAPGRVIVSATRSRAEKYDTIFPAHFVDALQNLNADRDKNGRVSVLEAFNYTKTQVEGYFKDNGLLPSEHATLDDNGDNVLSVTPSPRGDGRIAEIAYFDVLSNGGRYLSDRAAQLKARMANLERDVILLRNNKANYSEAQYWVELETLLVELAKVTRDFNAQVNR